MRTSRLRRAACLSTLLFLLVGRAPAQDSQKSLSKADIRHIHDLGKVGPVALHKLAGYLQSSDSQVRVEAVKAIVKIGSIASLDPLIAATHDADSEVRVRATDGIVNVYLPGFVAEASLSGYFTRGLRRVKSFFASRNDSIIDPDVSVRPDVGPAISEEINFGEAGDARSNAALAAGILRLKAAVPALVQALHANDHDLTFESLIALQKIHEPAAAPSVGFLVRDADERIQITALETVGVLGSQEAAPDGRYALENARNLRVRRAALSALAMLALPPDRPVFKQYVMNDDPELRASALEGLGRLREPEDTPALQTCYDEAGADWRVHQAAAFALADEGDAATSEFSPLAYLVESLNTATRANAAAAYLKELMHHEDVRRAIAAMTGGATRTQRLALCWIFAASDSDDILPALNQLGNDPDAEVASAARRAAHVVQSRHSS